MFDNILVSKSVLKSSKRDYYEPIDIFDDVIYSLNWDTGASSFYILETGGYHCSNIAKAF